MNERVRGVTAVAEAAAAEPARAGDAQAAEHSAAEHSAAEHSAPEHEAHHDARRGDTRARIQQVALELFAEQGYDKTSLREIAERLDVTKAALYYHFKSKEDIVRSLAEDYFGQIDALIEWARSQPRMAETRAQILRRYVQIVADGSDVFRMLHHNQAALASLDSSVKRRGELFRERMTGLVDVLIEDHAGPRDRLRAAMTLGGVSVGWMTFVDEAEDRSKLCAAVLDIATTMAQSGSD
jgi:AcrR family transcriptional regulator